MKRLSLAFLAVFTFCLWASAQTDTIRVSTLSTSHLLFKDELTYVDISNKAVAAKIIDSDKSILALKAREPFPFLTTVSALEATGEMHTFIVMYDESPERLIFNYRQINNQMNHFEARPLKAKDIGNAPVKHRLYHIADVNYGISFACLDIWVDNDATWFALTLENGSGIRYDCPDALFVVENRKKVKRSIVYERQLTPLNVPDKLSTASGSASSATYSFDKLAITKDQILKVYLYESGGSRNYTLTMTPSDVNRAARH